MTETLVDIFYSFLTFYRQITNQLIKTIIYRLIDYENNDDNDNDQSDRSFLHNQEDSHLELPKQADVYEIKSLKCPISLVGPKKRLLHTDLQTVVQANLPM